MSDTPVEVAPEPQQQQLQQTQEEPVEESMPAPATEEVVEAPQAEAEQPPAVEEPAETAPAASGEADTAPAPEAEPAAEAEAEVAPAMNEVVPAEAEADCAPALAEPTAQTQVASATNEAAPTSGETDTASAPPASEGEQPSAAEEPAEAAPSAGGEADAAPAVEPAAEAQAAPTVNEAAPAAASEAPAPAAAAAPAVPPGPVTTFRAVDISDGAKRTTQPMNRLSQSTKPSSSTKTNICLSAGDPTVDGNFKVPAIVNQAVLDAVQSAQSNGYPPTAGYTETRQTVAQYWARFCSTRDRRAHIKPSNVLMTCGVSHGVMLSIATLCNAGDNVLICAPAFPQYQSVCESYGVECRFYHLLPDQHWESDLAEAATLVDERTRAFITVNPSNPCGSNFSREHLTEVVHFCEQYQLVLVSDEIFAEMVFPGQVFTTVADFDTVVPRIVLGGPGKYQMCPGWRVGWTILVDPLGVAATVQAGMERLAELLCGPNSICQQAVGRSLLRCSRTHTSKMVSDLMNAAKVFNRLVEHDVGLSFDAPHAGIFVLIKVNYDYFSDIASDMEFYEKLLDEENVQVLPGQILGVPGFVRATFSRPVKILNEAVDRITAFCERHKKQ